MPNVYLLLYIRTDMVCADLLVAATLGFSSFFLALAVTCLLAVSSGFLAFSSCFLAVSSGLRALAVTCLLAVTSGLLAVLSSFLALVVACFLAVLSRNILHILL